MFKTAVLASGSKGNCFLVKTQSTKIIFDAGLSAKKIFEAMSKIDLEKDKIDAIVVSHEHSDHVKGAGIICRKLKIPLFISESTFQASRHKLGKMPSPPVFFENGASFDIGDLIVTPFSSSHDVIDGSNFVIQKNNDLERKLAIVTDLGYPSRLTIQKLQDVTTIILESNHDETMLLEGPYPWELKQRVKSREGHLSNSQAVGLTSKIIHSGLKNIILAHLSEQNNTPELAYKVMNEFLKNINFNLNLIVSDQYQPTQLIDV